MQRIRPLRLRHPDAPQCSHPGAADPRRPRVHFGISGTGLAKWPAAACGGRTALGDHAGAELLPGVARLPGPGEVGLHAHRAARGVGLPIAGAGDGRRGG